MYTSKLVDGIEPYTPGEQLRDSNVIKLNTNENPYPPTPNVAEVLTRFDTSQLRLYNDPENTELRKKIAEYEGVEINNVFVGNGSDEVLAMAFPAFASTSVTFREITYSFYEVFCKLFRLKPNILPVKDNLQVDVKQYLKAKGDMLVICNPNAPTGQLISAPEIEHILKSNTDKVVLIDEAYAPFSKESAVHLIKKYPNLLVVKTFSKAYSLAGIRCGYAIADSALIETLKKIKNSFNSYTVNALTEAVAIAAIDDADYVKIAIRAIVNARNMFVKMLKESDFYVLPSETNFVFAAHPEVPAEYIYNELKKRNILVRYFKKPKIDNYLRITIGTSEQMIITYKTILEIVKNYKK